MAKTVGDGDTRTGKLARPGRRTGEGVQSIVPYLRDELATKPKNLSHDPPKPRRSLASRMRDALLKLNEPAISDAYSKGGPPEDSYKARAMQKRNGTERCRKLSIRLVGDTWTEHVTP